MDSAGPGDSTSNQQLLADQLRQSEEALRDTQQRLALILEGADVGLWDWNLITNAVVFSREWKGQLGYREHEVAGHVDEWRTRVHPDDLPPTLAKVQSAVEQCSNDYNVEFRMRHKDGSWRWILARGFVLAGPDSRPARMLGVHVDITERKLAEERLRSSESRYLSLVDNLDGIVWEADAQSLRFRFVSRQAERILGFPLDRWFDEPTFWRDQIHPDDREWAVQYCLDRTGRGEGHDFEYRMLAADGREVWLHDVVSVEMLDGQPVTLRGVMVDITERKRAEETLRKSQAHLVASQRIAQVGSWELGLDSPDLDSNALQWSDEAYRVFGYEPGQVQPSNATFWTRVHPEDRSKVQQAVRQAIDTRSVYEIEHRIVLDDGEVRIIHERAELALDPRTGKPLKFIGTSQDVTERRRVEEALTVQQAELLHASRLSTVGQMVASLSHEVAQPLSAIGNFAGACASILESATASGVSADQCRKLQEYTSAIAKQNERCRGILERLRDFSGRTRRLSSCDLNELLRDSAELTAYDFRRLGIALQFDLPESLPPVRVDRVQIQQVIVNLLTNARDAICDLPSARREITLRSRTTENGVLLAVEDRGEGFSEEARRRLFEPFFTTKPNGMGIGLSICQTIVKDHGGQIEALANRHGGATFRVQLPLCLEDSHD